MRDPQAPSVPPACAPRLTCVIAVPTFRRNDRLRELLPLLISQGEAVAATAEVTVLVVDNDPDAGAREVVSGQSPGAIPVRYAHEPTPGIAAARNRALAEAEHADVIAFLDDDEQPDVGWLAHLLRTWSDHDHASVTGRVVPSFEQTPDPWIESGRFFVRPSLPTGTPVPIAAAGNLLLDLATVRRMGLQFDPRLGLVGGEDTLFTRTLTERGGSLVFCQESIVFDRVPAHRASRRWLLRRALSHGNTAGLLETGFPMGRSARAQVRLTAGASARVAVGLGIAGAGFLCRRDYTQARGLGLAARGLGMALGACGRVYVEYARPGEDALGRSFVRARSILEGDQQRARRGLMTSMRRVRGAGSIGPVMKVRTSEALLALTFDDGPDPEITPRLLELLGEFDATATFFVLVSAARRYPEIVRRVVAEGHEVALHGIDHRRLTTKGVRAGVDHVAQGRAELARLTGVDASLFRPPYGATDPVLWAALRRSGLESVLWSATTWDWRPVSQDERLAKIHAAGIGDIVLAHDGRASADDGATEPADRARVDVDKIELIAQALSEWRDRGLRVVSVGEALRRGTPVRSGQYRELVNRLLLRRLLPPARAR